MADYRVVLFDADGVVVMPHEELSRQFAEAYGFSAEDFQGFFGEDYTRAITGRVDFREVILQHSSRFKQGSSSRDMHERWLAAEDIVDERLVKHINLLRKQGIWVGLATHQEAHRAKYIREVMLPDVFDDYFMSCDLAATKDTQAFWNHVLMRLQELFPDIQPADILFFDDDEVNVEAARAAGIAASQYRNISQVETELSIA